MTDEAAVFLPQYMSADQLYWKLVTLRDEFTSNSEECKEYVGRLNGALEAAVVWENAAKKVNNLALEIRHGARDFQE